MSTTDPRIYRIPEENWDKFQADIAKLAKRAAKLDVPAPVINRLGVEDIPVSDDTSLLGRRLRRVHLVTVTGEASRYDGWSLTAVIDRDPEHPAGPHIVHSIDGADINPQWRALGDICEHCDRDNTGRKVLVVVQHANGEQKVIGSTCLRDFLGHKSPTTIAAWAELIASLDDRFSEHEESIGGEYRYDPVDVLAVTAKVIDLLGWTPRSAHDGQPTANIVGLLFSNARKVAADFEVGALAEPATAGQRTEAAAALDWAKGVGGNDYLDNLAAIAAKESFRVKDLGLAASIIPAWRREQGKILERQAEAEAGVVSDYVGKPKDRIEIEGTVTFTLARPGDFGIRTLVKIIDDNGNQLAWWASSDAPEQGARVSGKATVKGHSEYRGVKETAITRFKWETVEFEESVA